MTKIDPDIQRANSSYGAAAARSGIAVALAKSARYGLLFLVQAFLMNLLVPDQFGLMKYVTIILGLVNLITVAGLNTAIIQKKILRDDELGPIFILNFLLCLILFALIFAAAPAAARFFGEPMLTPLLRFGSLAVPVGGISTVHRSLLQREFRYGTLSVNEAVSAAVSSTVSIILAFKGYGAWSLCWSLVVFHLVSSAMCLHARPGVLSPYVKRIRQKDGRQDAAPAIGGGDSPSSTSPTISTPTISDSLIAALPLFWFGVGWTFVKLLDYLNTNLGNLLIGRFFGSNVLGTFTIAFDIVSVPQLGFGLVLVPIALSVFARIQDDEERMKNAYLKIVFFTSIASTIYCIIIGLYASDIIKTITILKPGDTWNDTVVFIRWLAPLGLVYSWSSCSGVLWAAKRKIKLQIIWTAAMTISTAVFIIVGAGYGYIGVCAALLIRAAVTFPILLYIMDKVSRIPPLEYLKALLPSLICGAAAAAVCLALQYLLTGLFPVHHTARLAICGVLSTAVFAGIAVGLYGDRLKTLKYYIKPAQRP